MRASTLTSVLAFAVLTDNHPIKVSDITVAQGRLCAAEDTRGTHIGVLLEGLADGETEAPEGDVVGNIYIKYQYIDSLIFNNSIMCNVG